MPILKNVKGKNPHTKHSEPVWTGPNGEGRNGGVTQGALSRYLTCRERFRIGYVEGLRTTEGFNSRLEYGNMWHMCEEAHARNVDPLHQEPVYEGSTEKTWGELQAYAEGLSRRYLMDREQINHWYNICRALFPLYVEYWAEHDDVKNRTPILQEQVFDVPYSLPSGRVVRLRGKWDSVDLVGKGIWLQENKTKSSINEGMLHKQMSCDLQTTLYLAALGEQFDNQGYGKGLLKPVCRDVGDSKTIKGIRYNVIKRSAHKSVDSMLKKIADDRKANRMDEWFLRFNVEVTAKDIERFKVEVLNPVLENLCDDYEWWIDCLKHGKIGGYTIWDYKVRREVFDYHQARHHKMPFHYSPILEGASTDFDEYIATGSTVGLHRTETLFSELE